MYLEGDFIDVTVSAIVFPSMLISEVAPLDRNSLQKGSKFQVSIVSNLLENFFNFFLNFPLAPRSPLELLDRQPKSKVFVTVLFFQKRQKFLGKH